jgi:tetratricopeptide (TPR) repeat protein
VLRGVFNYRPVQVPIEQPVIKKVENVDPAEAALIPETIGFSDDDLNEIRKAGERERERARRAQLLQRIRQKAAQYANDPFALYLLAQAEKAGGNGAAAEQAVDRLLTMQPSNVDGMALKSLLLAQRAMAMSGPVRVQAAAEARRLAMAANKLDPDNPHTYVAFYQGFKASGSKVPANAVDGLAVAVEKLPSDTSVRQMLVDEYASEGQYAAAIAALVPIANSPHESPLRQSAREKMAALQAKLNAQPGAAKPSN